MSTRASKSAHRSAANARLENGASSNWGTQGSDAGFYTDDDIYAVRVLSMEPTSHRSYGPGSNSKRRG